MKSLSQYIIEGVTINDNTFKFDYQTDNADDIISLTTEGVRKCDYNGIGYYLYAYKFNDNVNRDIRTKFLHDLKFSEEPEFAKERERFIKVALARLNKEINTRMYDLIIYPESKSQLVFDMHDKLYKSIRPHNSVISFKLLKEIPKNIEFDYKEFKSKWLNSYINGRPRYTDKQKEVAIEKIKVLIDKIHQLDYFSIARDIKKTNLRQYIKNYLKFGSKEDEEAAEAIRSSKIMIIDDIATSGTTIEQILKAIAILSEPEKCNDITIFTLIGKEIG